MDSLGRRKTARGECIKVGVACVRGADKGREKGRIKIASDMERGVWGDSGKKIYRGRRG